MYRLPWRLLLLACFRLTPSQPDSGPPALLNCAKYSVRHPPIIACLSYDRVTFSLGKHERPPQRNETTA